MIEEIEKLGEAYKNDMHALIVNYTHDVMALIEKHSPRKAKLTEVNEDDEITEEDESYPE